MDHKTVISVLICFSDTIGEPNSIEHKSAIEKLKKLKQLIIDKDQVYSFEIFHNGSVYTVNGGLEEQFDQFIHHIQNGVTFDDELGEYVLSPGDYANERVDMEEGEIFFEDSFVINESATVVYVNTQAWYSSELERLTYNEVIGLDCEMNDIDGDFYEFSI
jgi:restriction endonuclease S subunit